MTDLEVRYFLAVVNNECSFTKASRALYVSQPSLTKQINKLSKEIGIQLFDTRKKIEPKLTPGGVIMFNYFSEHMAKLHDNISMAKKSAQNMSGEIKFLCIEGMELEPIVVFLDQLNKQQPNIKTSLIAMGCSAIEKNFLNDRYDIAFTISGNFRYHNNIQVKDLYKVPRILLYSNKHPLAQKKNLQIIDFKDETFFTFPETSLHPVSIIHEYCASKGFLPKLETLPNLASILLAIERGGGCVILSGWTYMRKHPDYDWFPLDSHVTLSAVWRINNHNPALKLFLTDILSKHELRAQK